MKLLIVSDTHGNLLALEEAVKREQDAEFVLHLGDGLTTSKRCGTPCAALRPIPCAATAILTARCHLNGFAALAAS